MGEEVREWMGGCMRVWESICVCGVGVEVGVKGRERREGKEKCCSSFSSFATLNDDIFKAIKCFW